MGDHVTTKEDPVSVRGTGAFESEHGPVRASGHKHGRTRAEGRQSRWPAVVCIGLYLVLAMVEFGRLGSIGSSYMAGPRGADQIAQVWWIEWALYALSHGHNLFFSTWQNYPFGLNAGVNGSMLVLGVLLAPITKLVGPVVVWNLLLHLAIVLSATSMCMVLRRWTMWWPAAFFGGVLYGFSVYETVLGSQYLFLVFVPLPPLIFLLLHEALVRQQWRPARVGVLLGLVCGAQYLVSSEILASSVLMGAIASALYLLFNRASLGAKLPYIKTVSVYGVIVGGILLAYPVAFTLVGPEHIAGVPNAPSNLLPYHGDLLGPVVSGFYQRFSHLGMSAQLNPGFTNSTLIQASSLLYLGIPLVVMIILVVFLLRRSGIVVLAGAMTAISFILSVGTDLYIGGHHIPFPLPFLFLTKVPITQGFVPVRLALYTILFGSAVVAIGLDELHRRVRDSDSLHQISLRWRELLSSGIAVGTFLIVALPTLPAHTQQASPTNASPFFTSEDATANIPSGSTVLSYPYPTAPDFSSYRLPALFERYQAVNDPLLDQATSGMYFKLIGSYGWRPNGTYGYPGPSQLFPRSVETLFNVDFRGSTTPEEARILVASNMTADLRSFMRRYHVDTVVVFPKGQHPKDVVAKVTAALGAPVHSHGATVWFRVQSRLAAFAH
jgi:hypothetical protein